MFVIVRHGNTFVAGETPRRIGARTDIPLTEKGLEQARALGHFFAAKGWRFGRVLVSPLLRTRQSADAILSFQAAAPSVEIADFLREIDHGPDENKTEDEVVARIGADALAAWDREAVAPDAWQIDRAARIDAWRALLWNADVDHDPVMLVTSNGAARFALMADPALQAAAERLATLKLPTGGYGILRRSRSGGFEVPVWGERP
jgi:probable phosphoglycerate mutase